MAIPREAVADILPLTPMQEGLLWHALAEPDGPAYHQQLGVRLRGPLDRAALGEAWTALVARHAALRTVFAPHQADRPLQIVLRTAASEVAYRDLADLPDPEAALARLKAEDRAARFDLTARPPMRLWLARLAPDLHEVLWSHHHILLDGWSLAVLRAEVLSLMRAGTAAALPPPVPFSVYLRWLEGHDRGAAERYWRDRLAGVAGLTGVPVLSARAPGSARAGLTADLAPDLDLAGAAARLRVTVPLLLQAALAVVLARYGRTDDVVFGLSVSGRPADLPGMERMVGLFINTVPVRARVPDGLPGAALVARMRDDALAAEPHHALPLARLQAASGLPRDWLRVLLAIETYPSDPRLAAAEIGGLAVVGSDGFDQTDIPFVVQVLVARTPRGGETWQVRLSFDPGRHHAVQAEGLVRHWQSVLRALARDPGIPLGRIDLMDAAERAEALAAPPRPRPVPDWPEATIPRRFDRIAAERPEAVAVVVPADGDRPEARMRYRDLREAADRLAAVLRRAGAAGACVGLCLDRGLDLVVGLLGVLKAGAAYVPLDPAYPPERLRRLAEDTALRLVVAAGPLPDGLSLPGVRTVRLPLPADAADPDPGEAGIGPDSLAYILHTSGSTGRPKGVEITHRNVLRLLAAAEPLFAFDSSDVWSGFHSPAFDFSVWEIFGALLTGGRLVVVPYWISRAPDRFLALLRAQGVTMLSQTPSAFRPLARCEAEEAGPPLPLRHVVFGGEALDPRSLAGWFARHGEAAPRLVNMFGITETTVHVTHRALGAADLARGGSPIGAPLADLDLYLLDPRGHPVPVGVPGEIHVGGAGLARGYHRRPDLTAARFVPNPFGPGRLYRSGDLARRGPDGEIDHLGRADAQVKVRGFRIEPGEIEACLAAHPEVRDRAVIARTDAAGDARLVAYVAGTADPGALRAWLGARLPAHMVPAIVPLDRLPLTVNGKLDRAALPDPAGAGPAASEPPASPRERALAETWGAVLGRDGIGRHDDFFALGGDSIRLIQVAGRLRRLGWRLEMRDLARHPTVAALAPRLTALAPARPARAEADFPLTPIQARFVAEHRVAPHHFNHAVVLSAPRIDPARAGAALDALLRHHPALRLSVHPTPRGWRQRYAAAGPVPLPVVPGLDAAALESHAGGVQAGLDPAAGRLVRAALYPGPPEDRLLLVIHHLAVDGVSWRILLEDFAAAYAGRALPEPSDGFETWAAGLAGLARAPLPADEAAHWAALRPEETVLPGTSGAADLWADAVALHARLPADLGAALLGPANAAFGTTAQDLLLAGLARCLADWTGRPRTVIALEGHGRAEVLPGTDFSRTVGWFTSLHPFALAAEPGRDAAGQVRATKEALRRVPRAGLGFGLLAHLPPPEPDPDASLRAHLRALRPEAAFNYLGAFDGTRPGGFAASGAGTGPAVDPGAPRPFPLEFQAAAEGGTMTVGLAYNAALRGRDGMRALLDRWEAEIAAVAAACAGRRREPTPSDLTYAAIGLDELDEIFS